MLNTLRGNGFDCLLTLISIKMEHPRPLQVCTNICIIFAHTGARVIRVLKEHSTQFSVQLKQKEVTILITYLLFSIHLYFQSDPDPQPCRKLSRTHSGPGAAVVVVKVVALGPGRMSILGLQSSRGELDRADQVRYMMYIEMREDWSSPELGICS